MQMNNYKLDLLFLIFYLLVNGWCLAQSAMGEKELITDALVALWRHLVVKPKRAVYAYIYNH